MGDVYQIPAGSAFYLVNIEEAQKLHIICSIDPSESLGIDIFQVHASIIIKREAIQYTYNNLYNIICYVYLFPPHHLFTFLSFSLLIAQIFIVVQYV